MKIKKIFLFVPKGLLCGVVLLPIAYCCFFSGPSSLQIPIHHPRHRRKANGNYYRYSPRNHS